MSYCAPEWLNKEIGLCGYRPKISFGIFPGRFQRGFSTFPYLPDTFTNSICKNLMAESNLLWLMLFRVKATLFGFEMTSVALFGLVSDTCPKSSSIGLSHGTTSSLQKVAQLLFYGFSSSFGSCYSYMSLLGPFGHISTVV